MHEGELLHELVTSPTRARLNSDLPERYARLYDYQTGKFETPLDSQGIANIDALFELAIRTYPDELPSFENDEYDKHHIYWSKEWWRQYALAHKPPDRETIHTFRNSTPQLAYVPRVIHAWIEEIMIPPPAPPLEVMRRRNDGWSVAVILLRSAVMLDKARDEYEEKKNTTRTVLGKIDGITPLSQQSDFVSEERVNREYWLSELTSRLDGWRQTADKALEIPEEHRIVSEARLFSVRALGRRIKDGAIMPRLPATQLAA